MADGRLSRVVWREGMHLAQHHFQAQTRYFESALDFTVSTLFPGHFGLLSITLDHEALWDGTVRVLDGSGIMPDGLGFHFGEGDEPPASRDTNSLFGPSIQNQIVYLAIPRFRPQRANVTAEEPDAPVSRFSSFSAPVVDENSGDDARHVQFGRKEFRLAGAEELTDDTISLPIARVRADRSGRPEYDTAFVPPLLRISASTALMRVVRGTVELLESKADALGTGGPRSSDEADVHSAWMRHAVLSGIASLRMHSTTGRSHPRTVYEDLVRVAGALCTFTSEVRPDDLPSYDHRRPGASLSELQKSISTALKAAVPERALVIPLEPVDGNLFTAPLVQPRALEDREWLLGVRSSASAAEVARIVPRTVRVCSADVDPNKGGDPYVVRLVRQQRPGLALEHLRTAPAGAPSDLNTVLFRIERDGPCWELIRNGKSIGAFVSDAVPDVSVDLVVLPSRDAE